MPMRQYQMSHTTSAALEIHHTNRPKFFVYLIFNGRKSDMSNASADGSELKLREMGQAMCRSDSREMASQPWWWLQQTFSERTKRLRRWAVILVILSATTGGLLFRLVLLTTAVPVPLTVTVGGGAVIDLPWAPLDDEFSIIASNAGLEPYKQDLEMIVVIHHAQTIAQQNSSRPKWIIKENCSLELLIVEWAFDAKRRWMKKSTNLCTYDFSFSIFAPPSSIHCWHDNRHSLRKHTRAFRNLDISH